jgi:hypothetical protein
MTIIEAITRIDAIKPNPYKQPEKVMWISNLEGIIKTEIIDTHEGSENVTFEGFNEHTALTTELLVPAPYDEIYLFWLESKIDYWNGETGKYNNSVQMYNTAYTAYERFYNRTHMPKGTQFKYWDKHKTPEYQAANAVAKVAIEEDNP